MSLSLEAVNSSFLLVIDDCLPGIVTCSLCLRYLRSNPSLPPHPLPSSHVCFCTYGIPLLPSSTSSGSRMHTAIAHHTIPTNSSPCTSYPSPSSPSPQRDCVEPTPHLGLGPACQFGRLMSWKNSGSTQKSNSEVNRLVHEVLQATDFNAKDLASFDASTETSRFDAAEKEIPPEDVFAIDRWRHTTIDISVPTREKKKEGNGVTFSVDGLRYRPILDVIRAVLAEVSSKSFHLTPFKRLWKSPITGHEQRVYDELYASDAWNQAHDEIMKQRRDDGCKLERVVAGLMFWSDSTRLAQFGHASAWPIYLFFGNLSKYARTNPESGCCHPIVFIPSVN